MTQVVSHGLQATAADVAHVVGRTARSLVTRNGVVGLDPATGSVQFQRPWRARMAASVNVATPLVIGDLLFVSAEYGPGAAVLHLEGSKLTDVWASDDVLSNHYATSVYREVRVVAERARATAWMARAASLPGGKGLSIW